MRLAPGLTGQDGLRDVVRTGVLDRGEGERLGVEPVAVFVLVEVLASTRRAFLVVQNDAIAANPEGRALQRAEAGVGDRERSPITDSPGIRDRELPRR
jgi:hypothetical protein